MSYLHINAAAVSDAVGWVLLGFFLFGALFFAAVMVAGIVERLCRRDDR